jgi:hypothetical protein
VSSKNLPEIPALPEGMSLESAGDVVTIVSRYRDLGDAWSLGFLALVVVLFSIGVGAKAWDALGAGIALAVTSPLWGWLGLGALQRLVNTTRVVVKAGELTFQVRPLARGGPRTLTTKDITSVVVRAFEHQSSTRGGKLLTTKTYSVIANLDAALHKDKELVLLDPLDTDAQARFVERAVLDALHGKLAKQAA